MSEKLTSLDADARAVLERVGGGERLFHASPYKSDLPRYYFAESGGSTEKEHVQPELVNSLVDTRLLEFPPFSDSTLNTWTEAGIADRGRQVLNDGKAKE